MALQRQMNFLGQMRLDVPHLRMLESAVAADFDALAGNAMAGLQAYVLKGFELVTVGAVGTAATALQVTVASSVLIHPLASEAGSVFTIADDAAVETLSSSNAKVEGAFVASTTNYVGIDLIRDEDDDTADLVMFLNALTLTETPRTVPLARTLGYKFVITTQSFSALPNLCPVAKVTTNSSNIVTEIEDARQLMFRLGQGGDTIDVQHVFPWAGGRAEGVAAADIFQGGDKAIGSLKEWMDGVMTRLWELGGGERWYGVSSDREVKVCYGQPVLANGDNFDWDLGTETLEWGSLTLAFANSTAVYNTITDDTMADFADGECLYVDCDRADDAAVLVMQKAVRATLGAPTIPGSRIVIAWRRGDEVFFKDKQYEAGRLYAPVASTVTTGTVKFSYAAGTLGDPVVAPIGANGAMSNSSTAGNTPGFAGIGFGNAPGLRGTGRAAGTAAGVEAIGGSGGGHGIVATRGSAGVGVSAVNAQGDVTLSLDTGAIVERVDGAGGGLLGSTITSVGASAARAFDRAWVTAWGGQCSRVVDGCAMSYDGTTVTIKPGVIRFANGSVAHMTTNTTLVPGSSGTGPQYVYMTTLKALVLSTAPNVRGTDGNADRAYVGSIMATAGTDESSVTWTTGLGQRFVGMESGSTDDTVSFVGNTATRGTAATFNFFNATNTAGATGVTRTYMPTAHTLRWHVVIFWSPGASEPTGSVGALSCVAGGLNMLTFRMPANTSGDWQGWSNTASAPRLITTQSYNYIFDTINADALVMAITVPTGWEYQVRIRLIGYIEDVNNPAPWA